MLDGGLVLIRKFIFLDHNNSYANLFPKCTPSKYMFFCHYSRTGMHFSIHFLLFFLALHTSFARFYFLTDYQNNMYLYILINSLRMKCQIAWLDINSQLKRTKLKDVHMQDHTNCSIPFCVLFEYCDILLLRLVHVVMNKLICYTKHDT